MRTGPNRFAASVALLCLVVFLVASARGCSGPSEPNPGTTVTCQPLKEGKEPKTVARWKYDVLREAINEVISTSDESPVAVDTLDEAVVEHLTAKEQSVQEIGNNMEWWTYLVLDDMEVQGAVERVMKDGAEFVTLKE